MGKHEVPPGQGGDEDQERSERSFLVYQTALARRRIEDIMKSDDLAMILYYRELDFVHRVLSAVDSRLRKDQRDGRKKVDTEGEPAPER